MPHVKLTSLDDAVVFLPLPPSIVIGGLVALVPFVVLSSIVLVFKDYKGYLALGPGGTPATVKGYLRIKLLGIFALQNRYKAPPLPLRAGNVKGYLDQLPRRTGPRPVTAGIAPHRQMTDRASVEMFRLLNDELMKLVATTAGLKVGTSCFEKHNVALFSEAPRQCTCNGEICHSHPSDGSLHMTLHPHDLKLALEAGWVERHPLARGGWFERFVPEGFILVYGPRTAYELRVVMELVKAATWFVNGDNAAWKSGLRKKQRPPLIPRKTC